MLSLIRYYCCFLLLSFYTNTSAQAPSIPGNDDVCNARHLAFGTDALTTTVDTATIEVGEEILTPPLGVDCNSGLWCDTGISGSVWYKFNAPSTGAVVIELCESTYNTQIAVYKVGDCEDFSSFRLLQYNEDAENHLICNDNNPDNDLNPNLRLHCLNPDEEYYILVDQWSVNGLFVGGKIGILVLEAFSSEPPGPVLNDMNVQRPTCLGNPNGKVEPIVSKGVPPFTYQWNTGATGRILTGLSGGQVVSVTITDLCGKTANDSATVPEAIIPSAVLEIQNIHIQPAFCQSGYISLDIAGGTPPYDVQWNDDSEGAFIWVEKGKYSATITETCGDSMLTTGEIIVEGAADAGPDVVLDCDLTQLGAPLPSRQIEIDNSITYNTSQQIAEAFSCREDNNITKQNSYYRTFDPTDFGIDTNFHIKAVEIAISFASADGIDQIGTPANPYPNTQPLECRIYKTTNENLSIATLFDPQITKINLPDITSPQMFSIPIDYIIPAGEVAVVEIWNPNGIAAGHRLVLGANNLPPLFNNRIWFSSSDCNIHNPLHLPGVPEPIINLVQHTEYTGNFNFEWTPSTGLDNPFIANPTVHLNPTDSIQTYTLKVIDRNGCISISNVEVDPTADNIYFGNPGRLYGGSNACYQSTITASISQVHSAGTQSFILSRSTDSIILAVNDSPSFDLSLIDFSTLGIPDCGSFTIHPMIHGSTIDFNIIVPGITKTMDLMDLINNRDLCGNLDLTGTTFMVNCQNLEVEIMATVENCGQSDATATATNSNGMPPYNYLWSNGQTTATATNLSAGIYSLSVTDANACSTLEQFRVDNSVGLQANLTLTPPSCHGLSDGNIIVDVAGGTSPYAFQWNNGSTQQDQVSVSSGFYSLTLTDALGCSFIAHDIFLDQSEVINVNSAFINPITCNGLSDGSIAVVVVGGSPPFGYTWNNGHHEATNTDLSAGSYSFTITDSKNCTFVSEEWILTEPMPLDIISVAIQKTACNGDANGSISINPDGGTSPYVYEWNTGLAFPNLFNLDPDNYIVTITDANDCSLVSPEYTLDEPEKLELTLSNISNPSCFGFGDGNISVLVSGGTPPYATVWNTGAATPEIDNLAPGLYSLSVTDANGCTNQFLNLILSNPTPMQLEGMVVNESSTQSDGSISVDVSGGFGNYSYEWSNGVMNQAEISDLEPGIYCVTVTDENGCEINFCGEIMSFVNTKYLPEFRKIELWPNPTTGPVSLKLEFGRSRNVAFEIINALGQGLQKKSFGSLLADEILLDLEEYANGIYFVKITVDDNAAIYRLVLYK